MGERIPAVFCRIHVLGRMLHGYGGYGLYPCNVGDGAHPVGYDCCSGCGPIA